MTEPVVTDNVSVDTSGSDDGRAAANEAVKAAIADAEAAVPEDDGLPDEASVAAEAAVAKDEAVAKEDNTEVPEQKVELKSKLSKIIKEREKARRIVREAEESASAKIASVHAMEAKLAARERDLEEKSQYIERLKKNPLEAIKEAGYTPEAFFTEIATDGTPEGNSRKEKLELQQQLNALTAWKKAQEDAAVKAEHDLKQLQHTQYKEKVISDYLSTVRDTERFPVLNKYYAKSEQYLVQRGHEVADIYRQATISPESPKGLSATYAQIAEYLEEEAALSLSSDSKAKSGAGKPTQGAPAKIQSGSEQSSERRTQTISADKPQVDRDEMAKAAVRAVMKANGIK